MKGEEWSNADLVTLGKLVRDKASMRDMRDVLGRSTNAIQYALRNMVIHQLFEYEPDALAQMYGMESEADFRALIVPAKFNVAPPPPKAPGHTRYASEGGDNDAPTIPLCALALLMTAGISYYMMMLQHGWTRIMTP